jgi:hypothetical protein
MMKPNLAVRIITLSAFTILMSGFVAYKAGAFENESNIKADSPVKDTAYEPVIMAPSSKSAPVFEPETTKDTSKPRQQQQNNRGDESPNQNAAPPKQKTYMGSSKSGGVFRPQPADTSKPK